MEKWSSDERREGLTMLNTEHVNNAFFQEIRESVKDGLIPGKIHNDEEIFEMEKKKLFGKAWVFVAHETEIPNPGDYVLRYVVDDSVIVSRGDDNKINVFFNYCTHRGMPLCRSECGNTKKFTCPYHGFIFKNNGELAAVPSEKLIFGPDGLDRKKYSLYSAAQVDTYNGLIFVCLDPEGESLQSYLGDMRWYLDFFTARTEGGFEVIGPPERWIVNADWKLASENLAGDSYHASFTHQSVMEVGIHPNKINDFKPGGKRDGIDIDASAGTMAFATSSPQERGYTDELVEQFRNCLSPEQVKVFTGENARWPTRAHVFPNLSFLNAAAIIKPGVLVPCLMMRLWRPLGAGKTEVFSWVLVEKTAPDWFKEATMRAYVLTFGASGTEDQDDAENWIGITQAVKTTFSKDFTHLIGGGLKSPDVHILEDWPGPGKAYSTNKSDMGQRLLINKWLDYMMK